jgi:hypothetical protein
VPTFSGSFNPKCCRAILVALEKALHERFVDDGDRSGRFVVGGRERAPAHDANAEILQVVGADAVPRRPRVLAQLRRRMAGDEHQLAPVVGHGL